MPTPGSFPQPLAAAKVTVVSSRHAYRCCHIRLPDQDRPVAAIHYQASYYSLFRVEPDQTTALAVADKLSDRDETTVLTQIPKGCAIWVREGDAHPTPASTPSPSPHAPIYPSTPPPTPYQVLTSAQQYRPCWIAVAGRRQPQQAIAVEDRYYSLLDIAPNIRDTARAVKKLAHRNIKTVVTKVESGYGIWLLEPTARPVSQIKHPT